MKKVFVLIGCLLSFAPATRADEDLPAESTTYVQIDTTSLPSVRAIHITAAAAASKKYREKLDTMFDTTIINAVIIDMKDETGEVYVPGVKSAERVGSYKPYIRDIKDWLAHLKSLT